MLGSVYRMEEVDIIDILHHSVTEEIHSSVNRSLCFQNTVHIS